MGGENPFSCYVKDLELNSPLLSLLSPAKEKKETKKKGTDGDGNEQKAAPVIINKQLPPEEQPFGIGNTGKSAKSPARKKGKAEEDGGTVEKSTKEASKRGSKRGSSHVTGEATTKNKPSKKRKTETIGDKIFFQPSDDEAEKVVVEEKSDQNQDQEMSEDKEEEKDQEMSEDKEEEKEKSASDDDQSEEDSLGSDDEEEEDDMEEPESSTFQTMAPPLTPDAATKVVLKKSMKEHFLGADPFACTSEDPFSREDMTNWQSTALEQAKGHFQSFLAYWFIYIGCKFSPPGQTNDCPMNNRTI